MSKTKFVRCIDDERRLGLIRDKIYKVINNGNGAYEVVGAEGMWLFSRFKIVTGPVVVCIAREQHHHITLDSYYEVVEDTTFHYTIINDRGDQATFRKNYFESVSENIPEKVLVGYQCIKSFPGSPYCVGDIYSGTNSPIEILHGWPEFFKPIYEVPKPKEETLTLSNGMKVTVGYDKIEADGKSWSIAWLRHIRSVNKNVEEMNGYSFRLEIFTIGCKRFTNKDLNDVINKWGEFNKD